MNRLSSNEKAGAQWISWDDRETAYAGVEALIGQNGRSVIYYDPDRRIRLGRADCTNMETEVQVCKDRSKPAKMKLIL